MDSEESDGIMENNMKDNGRTIRYMGKVSLNGQTVECIKAVMLRIKRKDMELLHGLMAEFMKECGEMDARMVKGNTKEKMGFGDRAFGKMG